MSLQEIGKNVKAMLKKSQMERCDCFYEIFFFYTSV